VLSYTGMDISRLSIANQWEEECTITNGLKKRWKNTLKVTCQSAEADKT